MRDDRHDQFLDELLEASLKQYRGEEPRPGLEMRILAGIRSRERAAWRRGLAWAVAACVGVLAALILALHFTRAPIRQPAPRASLPQPTAKPLASSGTADARFWAPRLIHGPDEGPRTPKPGVRATKRPEQFPSPLPLTEQEKVLLAYLANTTKPDSPAETNKADEAAAISGIKVAPLEIEPLDDSQSGQAK